MSPRRALAGSLLLLAAWLVPATAHAEPTVAQCLASAERSLDLRSRHELRAAREELLVCASPACPTEVREECARRIDVVNAAIPTLALAARDATGADLVAVRVTIDGAPFADRLDGTALPLDPGEHTFRFESDGRPGIEKTLVIHEGEKARREVVVFGPPPSPSGLTAEAPAEKPRWGTQRTAAVASAAVGVVGLVVGVVYGIRTMSLWSSAHSECSSATSCPNHAQAVKDHDAATGAATVSNVGFVAGGAALATGLVLYFTY
ncbi:MAG TPA: hypothetical protein VF765_29290 [Polyangiaceae bacterium]